MSTSVWQPIPPPMSAPSGDSVEVLCGQPEQKYGVRAARGSRAGDPGAAPPCGSAAHLWASGTPCSSPRRRASTAATRSVSSSATGETSGFPRSSVLPTMRGASGIPYRAAMSWSARNGRFSSTTTISSSPRANARATSTSRGQTRARRPRRMPRRRRAVSSRPIWRRASVTARAVAPAARIPIRSDGPASIRSRRCARVNSHALGRRRVTRDSSRSSSIGPTIRGRGVCGFGARPASGSARSSGESRTVRAPSATELTIFTADHVPVWRDR